LPWTAEKLDADTPIRMTDGEQPQELAIGAVEHAGLLALRFSLSCPVWRAPTLCSIEIRPWPRGSLLVISHSGWPDISSHGSEQTKQRLRFSTLWVEALRKARHYVGVRA